MPESSARTVLCYGDSNTWGYNPCTKRRYSAAIRWPGVLRGELGPAYHVIEEGLNGRTTIWTDPLAEYRNGKHLLTPCLETHKPLDVVILMLGTNDIKWKFSATPYDIGRGMATLVDLVQRSRSGPEDGTPKVLLIAPPPVARLTEFAEMFQDAEDKSRRLPAQYAAVAKEFGCAFFDAGAVAASSDIDGIHLEAEAHTAIGSAVAAQIRQLLKPG